MNKETFTKLVLCFQLTTALLGGSHHAYNVWHDFNLDDHFHVTSHEQTLPPETSVTVES